MTNRLELSGIIAKTPVRSLSPAGIPHCHFVIEHRSVKQEAGLSREVYCRMNVVVSGQGSQALTANLAQGSNVMVGGFITYQTGRNGVARVVLHAEHIKFI